MHSISRQQIETLEKRLALSSISLVADINQNTLSSESTAFVSVGERYLFKGVDASDRSNLYTFDPSTLESSILKPLDAVPGVYGPSCDQIVSVGDRAFFFSIRADSQTKTLWVSDGTADGTQPIMNVGGNANRCNGLKLGVSGDAAYFQVNYESNIGLWRSDGTPEGTREILSSESGDRLPELPTRVGQYDVFFARTPSTENDWDLWSIAESSDTTERIAETVARNTQVWQLPELFSGNGQLFTAATTVSSGVELLISDGTQAGTQTLDLLPGPSGSSPRSFHELANGHVVFSAVDDSHGRELWKSNGTSDGTSLVKDILVGSDSSEPGNFWQFNGSTNFEARTLEHGREIWQTDGTEEGTRQLRDIQPGIKSGGFKAIGNIPRSDRGDLMLFASKLGDTIQLWTSDGTDFGIKQLSFVDGEGFTGATHDGGFSTATIDGMIAFRTYRNDAELWFTDGTADYLINSWFHDVGNPNITNLQSIGTNFFFTADAGPAYGHERYVSDGTSDGTRLVEDLNQRSRGSVPELLGQLNNGNYIVNSPFLTGVDPRNGSSVQLAENSIDDYAILNDKIIFELDNLVWVSDGTTNGTSPLADFSRRPDRFHRVGSYVYFRSSDPISSIWRTDGTASGTEPTEALSIGDGFDWSIEEVAGTAYYTTRRDNQHLLWSNAGLSAKPEVVTELSVSADGRIQGHSNHLFFLDSIGNVDAALFVTDGTIGNRTQLIDQEVKRFLLSADYLYFEVRDSHYGTMLWRSDGTKVGTFSLEVPFPRDLVDINGQVYFISDDFNGPRDVQLWTTDGSIENTVEVDGVFQQDSGHYYLHPNNASIVIYLDDGVGRLFESDGTAGGTKELAFEGYTVDLIRQDLFDADADGIYFTALTFETGGELFRIQPDQESHPSVVDYEMVKDKDDPSKLRSVTIAFDGDVGASLQARDLTIRSASRQGLAIDTALATMNWNPANNSAQWDMSQVEMDYGKHTIELDGQGVFDIHNNNLDGNTDGVNGDDFQFAFDNTIVGDLDVSGSVDFADFLILSRSFGKTNALVQDGDLDDDGAVSFADFLLLSANFGRQYRESGQG